MSESENVIHIEPERHLSKDEIMLLEALVKSPVYPVFCRLIRMQKQTEMGILMSSDNHEQLLRSQGKLQGLQSVENLPKVMAALADRIRKKEEAEKGKKK